MMVGAMSTAAAMVSFSAVVRADDALAPASSQQTGPQRGSDMASRVKQALHSDPSVLDKHVDVSMDKGKVVLSGFVTSADDLHKVVRMANETAGEKNVVNKLTIKEGGDGGSG